MSQRKEKCARTMERRMAGLEERVESLWQMCAGGKAEREIAEQKILNRDRRIRAVRRRAQRAERAAVLLVTALAFAWGVQAARAERGCAAIGGEYLLLFLPAMYYTGKRTILDWIADLREREKGGIC